MKYPDIKILSQELDMLGVIDYYTSLRHKRSWQGIGDFEFHIPRFDPELIKIGNIIMLDNKYKNGIITGFKSSFNAGKRDIAVTGTTLDGLASRRIVLPFEDTDTSNLGTLNGGYFCCPHKTASDTKLEEVPIETVMKTFARRGLLYDDNKDGNEDDNKRAFPNLAFIAGGECGKKGMWISRYEQLDAVLQQISEYYDVGWEIFLVLSDVKYLAFRVVPGIDRSCSQSVNTRVIISKEFGSAADITYSVDVSGYKNVAYAGGAGDDADRTVLAVTNEEAMPSGYDRFECFADCGTLEIAETETDMSLEDEGKHKLSDYSKSETLTATLTTTGSFAYGKDYELGDLVTVTDLDIGIEQDMRLTEVEECYEATSIQVRGVLGTSSANIGRTIKSWIPQIR